MRQRRASIGFTLVELLVVLAVVGLLTALLIPAVQSAREAARRAGCSSHLRQLGMAVHSYESVHTQFPAGRIANPRLATGRSVFVALLPFVEQARLFESFNLELDVTAGQNATSTLRRPGLYTCPSDAGAEFVADFGFQSRANDPLPYAGRVLTSYVAVFGAYPLEGQYQKQIVGGTSYVKSWDDGRGQLTGCLNDLQSVKVSDVTDGLSRTAIFTERNLWAVNNGGKRFRLPDREPYNGQPLGWIGLWVGTVWKETLVSLRLPPNAPLNQEISLTVYEPSAVVGSDHPGGVNVLLADGGVRFVSDAIESWPATSVNTVLGDFDDLGFLVSPPPTNRIWQALATRAGDDDRASL